jgi:hypothetical protein
VLTASRSGGVPCRTHTVAALQRPHRTRVVGAGHIPTLIGTGARRRPLPAGDHSRVRSYAPVLKSAGGPPHQATPGSRWGSDRSVRLVAAATPC